MICLPSPIELIQTYNIEERTFGTPCIFSLLLYEFKFWLHLTATTLTKDGIAKLSLNAVSHSVIAWFYSKGSSVSAQTFSISSQVSSDKSVEYIEKENLKDSSITENYCYSLKIKQSSTQQKLLTTVTKTCANNLQQNWYT